jgi:ubiquitin-protein ligase
MNNFYTTINSGIGLNGIQNAILMWKIKNVVTYMDVIKYISDRKISFIIEINDVTYNFSVEYDKNNDWRMSFDELLDQEKIIHFKILDLVDSINETYDCNYSNFVSSPEVTTKLSSITDDMFMSLELIYIFNIIEKAVDDFDFEEDDKKSDSDSSDSDKTNDAQNGDGDEDNDININDTNEDDQNNTNDTDVKDIKDNQIEDPMNPITSYNSICSTQSIKPSNISFDPFKDFDDEFDQLNNYNNHTDSNKIKRQKKTHEQSVINDLNKISNHTINDDSTDSLFSSIVRSDYNKLMNETMQSMMDKIDEYNNTESITSSDTEDLALDSLESTKLLLVDSDNEKDKCLKESESETNIDDDKYFDKLKDHYLIEPHTTQIEPPRSLNSVTTLIGCSFANANTTNYDYMDNCDDFNAFVSDFDNTLIKKKYNFSLLKTHAYEVIDKINHNKTPNEKTKHDTTMFKPEESVSIIINELKQLDKTEDIELIIENNNIYDFKTLWKSSVLNTDIEFNIKIDMLEYPYMPPKIIMTKPFMTCNLNYYINTMDCFTLDNWNPTNSILYVIRETVKLIEKYGVLSDDQSQFYSTLSLKLMNLAIMCKTQPKLSNVEITDFQIPFVKVGVLNQNSKYDNNYKTASQNQTWKSGTGYGSSGSSKWDIKKYLESDKYKLDKLVLLLSDILNQLIMDTTNEENQNNNRVLSDIKQSSLIEYLVSNLTENLNLSYIQINGMYLRNLINITNLIFDFDNSIFNAFTSNFENNADTFELIQKMSKDIVNPNDKSLIESLIELYTKILSIKDKQNQSDNIVSENVQNQISESDLTTQQQYVNEMKKLQWMMVNGLPNVCNNKKKLINVLHLCKEISVLSKSLPIDYGSSIYVRVDEDNMQSLNALIIPSDDTPYAFGCYLFHIYMPETYNKTPPLVQIVTTGGGMVRFNPNLYANGKVCLSLLGTWQGDASESWNESSTLLQVLVSIQSLIFIEEPYFNEPGHERSMNSEHGKKASKEYNKNIKFNNLTWAMVDMLKNPPKGFESVVKTHFKLKGNKILSEVNKWSTDITNVTSFNAKLKELKNEIEKLN